MQYTDHHHLAVGIEERTYQGLSGFGLGWHALRHDTEKEELQNLEHLHASQEKRPTSKQSVRTQEKLDCPGVKLSSGEQSWTRK